ncbi:hybrid sensor histidine kinase/response regulator [Alkalinema sp. FACHB-956]|uniref:hybrid sensor histidine kinase/response regulator n=1 Tax=Alkalinema sp. FACHB-956 TaxID=2692768 RepID=UPI0016869185|nr:hybrid sensor histidine kinase/response regulator [Alkalinema sp. FACHB-956]MBD2328026.1 hybrid sensor histidine kinase/response regulator [Alkalinema sp. FACHB-956]
MKDEKANNRSNVDAKLNVDLNITAKKPTQETLIHDTLDIATLGIETLKVLVVDDDPVDRMAVRRAFKGADFQANLIEAENCAKALSLINHHEFNCIFVDYRLPDGNGLDLVKQLRQQGIRIPIISLTGQSNDQIAVELMKAGASDYLSKSTVSPGRLRQVFQNVLRVYHAEKAAELANRQREELLQQKEEFISRMTHDLQTPLVAANRMLQLMQEDAFGDVPEKVKQRMNVIIRSNEDLLQMVRNIVEAYTYDANAKQFNLIPFEMTELIDEIIQELSSLANAKSLKLKAVLVDSEMPQASFGIQGDRLELKRLLTNLVGNSLKFTDRGSVTIQITAATPEIPWLTIQVQDTGSGIAPEDQPMLFERFRRGQHKRSNSGLGLYLCRQIVEAHGGQISVESQQGSGSTFTVKLPTDKLPTDKPPTA